VGRDPQHALAALDHKPLQRPRDVPAILKRPHPGAVEGARPLQQGATPAPVDRDRPLAEQLAGRGRDSGDRVRTLVSIRAEHDHDPRPPLDASGADVWSTRLAGGAATHLSSHARHPRPATSDKTQGSPARPGPTASKRVSSPPGRDHLLHVGRHRQPESKQQASKRHSLVRLEPALAGGYFATEVARGPRTIFGVERLTPPVYPAR
jgi:hypothetical protein